MNLETYGKKPLLFNFAVGIIKRKKGWVKIEERIALKRFDSEEEEE
jgi:hypothetical protein